MGLTELAATIPFFRALATDDRARLLASARARALPRGEDVFRAGETADEFVFVARGRVKMAKLTESGREPILDLAGAGELLCATPTCAHAPWCCTGAAMEDGTEVVAVSRSALLELFDRSPDAARAFVRELTYRTISLCGRVEELSSGQVDQRIARLVLRLADRAGTARADGATWVPVPLSRQDLADLCNTTIESAIRSMSRFQKAAVVETVAGGFVVRDRERLARVVAGADG